MVTMLEGKGVARSRWFTAQCTAKGNASSSFALVSQRFFLPSLPEKVTSEVPSCGLATQVLCVYLVEQGGTYTYDLNGMRQRVKRNKVGSNQLQ